MRSIFAGFSNVAGYATRLKRGFDSAGINADVYVEGEHVFDYSTDHSKSHNN